MSAIKKPMLATKAPELDRLNYPVLASPKLDGIRCLTPGGVAVSRNFKPIANDYIRDTLQRFHESADLDGELVTLDNNMNIKPFNEVSGDVMRRSGTPMFEYLIFDSIKNPALPFHERLEVAKGQVIGYECLRVVPHVMCNNAAELSEFEEYCVSHGYEGVMTRDPNGAYKQGRSTAREQLLLKVKRFADAEGVIVGFEELMTNTNEAVAGPNGSKRGMSQAGMVPAGTLGKLILHTKEWGEVSVGSGFPQRLRDAIWHARDEYRGLISTFTYQPSGMKDKPRFPVFKAFRDPRDMS